MRLPKDILFNVYQKPRIFLCETDKSRICQLETTETRAVLKFNAYSELSFDVGRSYNDTLNGEIATNPFYDKIEAIRLIELEGFGYFELQGPEVISNGIEEKKSCTAYSLEYTLSQKYLENFYINRGTADSIEVMYAVSEKEIFPVTLYNPSKPKLSLLHLVLEEAYGWKIGHVDVQLQTLSRQFEVDRESIYDFLMNEVCERFNCYIVFDTINNTVNVYAESLTAKFIGDGITKTFTITPPFAQINTVSVDGYKTTRWEYNLSTGQLMLEDTPEAGAHIEVVDGALTEWETDVFVTFDNLSQEININYDADTIKTRLNVTYGEDYDIREVNLGLPYLTDLSFYYTVDWMGQDLYDAYTKYLQKSNVHQAEYTANSQEISKINDYIAYEENRLSLEYSLVASVNAQTVGTYYTRQQNLDGSYYYSEVSLPAEYKAGVDYYSNVTTNLNEEKVSDLYGVLKKYFYAVFHSDDEGISEALDELSKLSNSFKFVGSTAISRLITKLKTATSSSERDSAIYWFLSLMWKEIGRTPLIELYLKPYKTVQDTNIKAGWSQKNNDNYGYYYPVILFINSIETEIAKLDDIILDYKKERDVFQKNNKNISDDLLMRNNFTEGQLIRLSAFIREDELHLDDIIETSQDSLSSSFKVKQDAMESGRIELQKLCQPQLQFSMTMANIYALPEFEQIIHQFQLGKVIRVGLRPDYIKQSRLLQIDINFDDFSDFSCEFGELTSLRTQSDIHADLLSKAISAGKSVATNSSYWTRGSDVATSTDLKIQQGLLDATTQIKAMDGTQGVVIDKYGIRMQEINPTTGEIAPEQGWITNNKFLYTDDGFKTTKSVFGKYTYDNETYYGILAEALVGSLLIGSQLKLENNNSTMSFDNNGLSVHNAINAFSVNPNSSNLLKLSNDSEDILWVDEQGKLHIRGDGAGLDISTNSSLTGLQSSIEQTGSQISSVVSATKQYDTTKGDGTKYSVALYGLTSPTQSPDCDPSEYKDKYYLNQSNGFLYISDGMSWTLESRLPLITDNLNSRITQTESKIESKVSAGDVISTINQSAEEIKISASKISFEGLVTANEYFQILEDGSIKAVNADISGDITTDNITATGGEIAGWEITGHSIEKTINTDSNDETKTLTTGLQIPGSGDYAIAVGTTDRNDWSKAPFRVKHDGSMYATSGQVGGFTITGNSLYTNGHDSISTTGYAGVYLGSNGLSILGKGGASYLNVDVNAGTLELKGDITATSGTFTGTVHAAHGGTIGGWNLISYWSGSMLYAKQATSGGVTYGTGMVAGTEKFSSISFPAFWAGYTGAYPHPYQASDGGEDWKSKTTFYVSHGGHLVATSANITGTITATSGSFSRDVTIGGRSISNWITEQGYINEIQATKGTFGAWHIGEDTYASSMWAEHKPLDVHLSTVYLSSESVTVKEPSGATRATATWANIANSATQYALAATNDDSDANIKNSIAELDEKYDVLFDSLTPCKYKYNFGTSDRYHTGFIAQEVIQALDDADLTTSDFAAVMKYQEPDEYGSEYGLRRDEFVALNTWQIQKLKKRVAELEAKLENME